MCNRGIGHIPPTKSPQCFPYEVHLQKILIPLTLCEFEAALAGGAASAFAFWWLWCCFCFCGFRLYPWGVSALRVRYIFIFILYAHRIICDLCLEIYKINLVCFLFFSYLLVLKKCSMKIIVVYKFKFFFYMQITDVFIRKI